MPDDFHLPLRTAKLFRNGRSQAVRLPKDFRFPGKEVRIRKDARTGDVILSLTPASWPEFFKSLEGLDVPSDFMTGRFDPPELGRDPFEDWEE